MTNTNNMETIKFFSKNIKSSEEYDGNQRSVLNGLVKLDVDVETLKICANPKFTVEKLLVLREAIEQGLSYDELKPIANPNNSLITMKFILEKTLIAKRKLEEAEKEKQEAEELSKYTSMQLRLFKWASEYKLNKEAYELLHNPEFSELQTFEVYSGLIHDHLNLDEIRKYAKPELSVEEMISIRESLIW